MLLTCILLALFGFLPLVIVLYRKNQTDKLQKHGSEAMGIIREINTSGLRSINRVMIEYRVKETGTIISKYIRVAGVPYAVGDQLRLFYDPLKPQRMQLDYKKGFLPMLIFTLIIGIVVCWFSFKIYQGVLTGEY